MATLKDRLKALASWGWKREGLPSWARFDKPYLHNLAGGKKVSDYPAISIMSRNFHFNLFMFDCCVQLTIHQSKATLGSTVWDSVRRTCVFCHLPLLAFSNHYKLLARSRC
jgi:hypothetical protein